MSTVRLIKHEVIPDCGSFEVRFDDGPALEQAKAFARAERDRQAG